MSESVNRIPSLDGLRAVSVTLVVVSHLFKQNPLGNFGVRVFFVISGFLITSLLFAELEKTSGLNLTKFYFRRTLRIFPAYYFYLLIILLLSLAGVFQTPLESFTSPLTYTSNYFEPGAWELGHSWSLSVEEQFYLVFPGLLLLCGAARIRRLLIAVVILTPIIRVVNFWIFDGGEVPKWFIFGFHTNMDALAIGALLTVYRKQLHENKHYQKFLGSAAAFFLLPLTIATIIYYYTSYSSVYFGVGITVHHICIALLLDWVVVNHSSLAGRILNLRPLSFVGVLSYSIYLWQQPFSKYAENNWWTHFPVNIILIGACSLLSYFLIEKTFLNWRQSLEKRFLLAGTDPVIRQAEIPQKAL